MAYRIPHQGLSLKEIKDRVTAQLSRGLALDSIITQLIERGWPEPTARRFVMSLLPSREFLREKEFEQRSALKDNYKRMLRGLLCVILGLVIIAVGLGMQNVANGLYHFTMGVMLIVFESHDFAAGLSGWFRDHKKH